MPPKPFCELPADELAARIRHARQARRLSLTDLDALLEEDGCDRGEATRLEHGQTILLAVSARSLSRRLQVPEEWFRRAS